MMRGFMFVVGIIDWVIAIYEHSLGGGLLSAIYWMASAAVIFSLLASLEAL